MARTLLTNGLTIIAALMVVASGCTDLKTVSYMDPPRTKLREYTSIEIATFETEIPDVPEAALTKLPEVVAKAIQEKGLGFKEIAYGDKELPYDKGTIVMFGDIVDYQSGRDIKAEKGSIKFAEASLTVKLSMVDKATGKEITNGEVNSSSSFGFLGKGVISKGVYTAIAEEIANFIKKNY